MRVAVVYGGLLLLLLTGRQGWGHGIPINVFLDEESNRLFIHPEFDTGTLNLIAETFVVTDLPGIGVLSPGNGVPDGSVLELSVTGGLLFWDGASVAETSAELTVESPISDGFGNPVNSPVEYYTVTRDSEAQTGMVWGTYQGQVPGWDTHGDYFLDPPTVASGIYAVPVEIGSPGFISTEPFLVPLLYDRFSEFDDAAVEEGIAALTEHWRALQSPLIGDANADGKVDLSDFVILRGNFGKELLGIEHGDFDRDGMVGLADFTLLKQNFGTASPVPEPSTLLLVVISTFLLCIHFTTGMNLRRLEKEHEEVCMHHI